MMYVQVVGGLLLLVGAAEVMVRGAVGLARVFGLSPLLIGMTVVALGTSAPELVVSLNAGLGGNPGVAVGNVVGSNIANAILIVGAAALLTPMARRVEKLNRDAALLILCTVLFVMMCWTGILDVAHGALLFIVFVVYMGSAYWRDINNPAAAAERIEEVEELGTVPVKPWTAAGASVIGLVGIALGADLMVDGGVLIARDLGFSEEFIGLTIIAFGTSAPELAASVVAARRGHPDVAIGNVIGSNMFNMLAIAGIVAMVVPLPVADTILAFDVWVMLVAVVIIVPAMIGMMGVSRLGGLVLVGLYVAYLVALVQGVPEALAEKLF